MSVIVIIDNHRYDVTAFIPNHPGEKKDHGIGNYNGQDITELFQRKHNKPTRRGAFLLLEEARKSGEYQGIKYLGPAQTGASDVDLQNPIKKE